MRVNFNKPQLAVSSQQTQVRSETANEAKVDWFTPRQNEHPLVAITHGLWATGAGVGAGLNYRLMKIAAEKNMEGQTTMALVGAAANVLGSVSLAGGLLTGNETATSVALALLAGSGFAAGMVFHDLCNQ